MPRREDYVLYVFKGVQTEGFQISSNLISLVKLDAKARHYPLGWNCVSTMSRKRRRSQAFPDPDEDIEEEEEAVLAGEGLEDRRLEKEREIWETVKEEHFESECVNKPSLLLCSPT